MRWNRHPANVSYWSFNALTQPLLLLPATSCCRWLLARNLYFNWLPFNFCLATAYVCMYMCTIYLEACCFDSSPPKFTCVSLLVCPNRLSVRLPVCLSVCLFVCLFNQPVYKSTTRLASYSMPLSWSCRITSVIAYIVAVVAATTVQATNMCSSHPHYCCQCVWEVFRCRHSGCCCIKMVKIVFRIMIMLAIIVVGKITCLLASGNVNSFAIAPLRISMCLCV